MNATKRIATLTLGLGILSACSTAFAHGPGHQPGQPTYPQGQTPGFLGYDYNHDYRVDLNEFQQRELIRCENDFRQNDRDRDGVVSDAEWRQSTAIHCEAWTSAYNWDNANDQNWIRPSLYPTRYENARWDGTRYQRPRVVRSYDRGLTWNEMIQASYTVSRRNFHSFDVDCDGSLNKAELRAFIQHDGARTPVYPQQRLSYYRAR